jgi:hypothetical protein
LAHIFKKEKEGERHEKVLDGSSGQRPNCDIRILNYFDRRVDAHVSTSEHHLVA